MNTVIFDMEDLNQGFQSKIDTSKTDFGAARIMRNCQITERGGISSRPGIVPVGDNYTPTITPVGGFYNFKRAHRFDEILLLPYDDKISILSKRFVDKGLKILKTGFTLSKEFGFVNSLVNEDNRDYVIGCNRFDNYVSWDGVICELTDPVVNGASSIKVDSVLEDEKLWEETSASATTTSLTLSKDRWAANQWDGLYVHIVSTGDIRKITSTGTKTINFASISGLSGAVQFEIRALKFKDVTGTIIYNGQEKAYTALPKIDEITVSNAHAADAGDLLFSAMVEHPSAPKGNRLANYLTRIVVGNVRSAVGKDSNDADQGYSSAGSYFTSHIKDPFDFSYSINRVAGEGDIISTPLGGGNITDVKPFEETVYIFKEDYIEALQFSPDSNDLPIRTPLKDGIGSVGKVIKGSDDIYFFTPDKKFASIGRAANKDLKPMTFNIGDPIQSFLNDIVVNTVGIGIEYKDRFYIPLKTSKDETYNNIVLVYNRKEETFEGVWDLPVFGFAEWDEKLVFASSYENVINEITDLPYDFFSGEKFPISSEYATHFFNLSSSTSNLQALCGLTIEGYVNDGASIDFSIWADHNETNSIFDATIEFDTEKYLDGFQASASLGNNPLGVGAISTNISKEVGPDGMRHFFVRIYFPFYYANYFSVGHKTTSNTYKAEILRYGLMLKEGRVVDQKRIK